VGLGGTGLHSLEHLDRGSGWRNVLVEAQNAPSGRNQFPIIPVVSADIVS
jgi:hypothetical protein